MATVVGFVADRSAISEFRALPETLYRGDPLWRPSAIEGSLVDHPPARPGTYRHFLIRGPNSVVGRLTAMRPDGPLPARLGLFECIDDIAVAKALVASALDWLHEAVPPGNDVIAPMDFDTWHGYRFRTAGFEAPPFAHEPYNPPYYPALLLAVGFNPAREYLTRSLDPAHVTAVCHRWEGLHRRALERGYRFETLNGQEGLNNLQPLVDRVFDDNDWYRPLSTEAFQALYGPLAHSDAEVVVAVDAKGSLVGFALMFPDASSTRAWCFKSFGVTPEVRGSGVAPALAYASHLRLLRRGADCVHHCLMVTGGDADRLDRGIGRRTRGYTLYSRRLPARDLLAEPARHIELIGLD